MHFSPPLKTGHFIRRHKRFLADIRIDNGNIITVHCPNTGAMRGCSTPKSPVAFSLATNPKRKYPHTLEMVQENGCWIGVNTARTNKIVIDAIDRGKIAQWQDVIEIQAEVQVSHKTRLDLRLTHQDNTTTMVEIKSCSFAQDSIALFPDAVTVRGTKHLKELTALAGNGQKCAMFYLVQRMDATVFCPAEEIDTNYAQNFLLAQQAGVKMLVYQAKNSPQGIEVIRELPIAKEWLQG